MSKLLKLYLSGSIRKGNSDGRSDEHFWSEHDEQMIRQGLAPHLVDLLNPAKSDIRRNDFALNFGCDLHLVAISDVVLVDARRERGIGVGAEMMFAVERRLPVITWAPPESHYRRRFIPSVFGEDLHNWTHPFVYGLSDYIVDNLDQAISLLRAHADGLPLARRTDVPAHIERYAATLRSAPPA